MAAELARRSITVEVLEQRPMASPGTRAIGVHAPVLAALEASGLTGVLLDQAHRVTGGEARSQGRLLGTVRFDKLSVRFPFVATLPQSVTEQVLSQAAPPVSRGVQATALEPAADQVYVHTTAGKRRAGLVIVAGGARSRHLVYKNPESHTYRDRYLMTDVPVADQASATTAVVHLDDIGVLESFPLPGGQRRFVAWDRPGSSTDPQAQQDRMERALTARGETVIGRTSGFGVRRYVAPRMRNGRIIVIGDAAHEVSPIGGQGMNLGLLDAATLAPLLGQWLATRVPPLEALHTWERARLTSSYRAAKLAGMNTLLGRPAPAPVDAVRRHGLRIMLGPGTGALFARAYSMGFDRVNGSADTLPDH